MKKIIFLSSFMFVNLTFAQEFKLTANNFVSKADETKNYEVIEKPGKTKEQLFTEVKKYVTASFKGLKFDGYNEVANEQIVLDVRNEQESNAKMFGMSLFSGFVSIRYEMNFKDGKFMIRPTFQKAETYSNNKTNTIYLTGGNFMQGSVFNKKGEVSLKQIYEMAVKTNEEFVSNLVKGVENNSNSDW
ncbi:hypothetical protein AAH994_15595 [Weeksellaceae bacterium A-14]